MFSLQDKSGDDVAEIRRDVQQLSQLCMTLSSQLEQQHTINDVMHDQITTLQQQFRRFETQHPATSPPELRKLKFEYGIIEMFAREFKFHVMFHCRLSIPDDACITTMFVVNSVVQRVRVSG